MVKAQINYVKSIDYGDNNPWVETIGVDGIFRNDDIKTIKNIGKEKKKVLNSMGIKTIQELHEYDASLHNLTKKENAYLKQALENSRFYQDEDRPNIKKIIFNMITHMYQSMVVIGELKLKKVLH